MIWCHSLLNSGPECVHPAYIEEIKNMQTQQPQSAQSHIDSFGMYSWRDFGVAVTQVRQRSFVVGLGAGLLIMALFGLIAFRPTESASVRSDRLPFNGFSQGSGGSDDTTAALRSEVEVIKGIVAGLVESIQVISRERGVSVVSAPASQPRYPFPIRVTSAKANLRKSPDRQSVSLFEALKDTTLIAFEGTDGWLKVNTPRGEDAWISKTVVEPLR